MQRMILLLLVSICIGFYSCSPGSPDSADHKLPDTIRMSAQSLKNKIKGGWAGQTIGVTFGGPYEFKYNGTFIQDYAPLVWHDQSLKETMVHSPWLYDDIYMDLTFVAVFDRLGLDAPVDSFAQAFAHAGYTLWHANQAARYNILHGIAAPQSGHWMHNPHADDIDYQIESDFSGLMSPGMPNAATAVGDKIGHIMNYGDGWYGGVYVGAMYTLAFISDDIHFIVQEALKTIPEQSNFYQCMADVIRWYGQYPEDWHRTWFKLQEKWSSEIGCPKGVFDAFDIDAKVNAAYVVMALLYGNGDYGRSLEIATRAGQDADCNPSTVGGILGTMLGYDQIPSKWTTGLRAIEDMDFAYTSMSLNEVYAISYDQALNMIQRNGGSVDGEKVAIAVQQPEAVSYEQSFEGMHPVQKVGLNQQMTDTLSFSFEGSGFVLLGDAAKANNSLPDCILTADLYIDGKKTETADLPTHCLVRRLELFWKYRLPQQQHQVKIVIKNPMQGYGLRPIAYLVYKDDR